MEMGIPRMDEQVDVDKVLAELKAIAARARNEEEFKINAERVLYDEVISKLGLQPGKFEYTFISGGRADALYGHLIMSLSILFSSRLRYFRCSRLKFRYLSILFSSRLRMFF